MSPLAQPPVRGYSDWQRVANYDTDLIISMAPLGSMVTVKSSTVDVSRFACVYSRITSTVSTFLVSFNWFSDPAGLFTLGSRQLVMTWQLGVDLRPRLTNRGPFMNVTMNPIGGVAFTGNLDTLATNRESPLEMTPQNALLLDVQSVVINAGTTSTFYPSDFYAGPMLMWMGVTGASVTPTLEALSGAGVWETITQDSIAIATNKYFTWIAPSGAWRLQVQNGGGANATFTGTAIPSLTGAT